MIGNDDDDIGDEIRSDNIYKGRRKELVLASFSESYSELDVISVGTSSTLLVYLTSSTNYLIYQLLS